MPRSVSTFEKAERGAPLILLRWQVDQLADEPIILVSETLKLERRIQKLKIRVREAATKGARQSKFACTDHNKLT